MFGKNRFIDKYYLKQIVAIILFWLLVVIIPLKIFSSFSNNGSLLIDYLIIIPIIIFILMYKIMKINETVGKILFIVVGFIIPYLFLLFYIYQGIVEGVNLKIL